MEKTRTAAYLRRRKFLLMLPLLVVPFLTMAFWALGGGSGERLAKVDEKKGLNMQLPEAALKDEGKLDKLSFYREADADSLKRAEIMRSDPYFKDSLAYRPEALHPDAVGGLRGLGVTGMGATEQQIYRKVEELNRQVNQQEQPSSVPLAMRPVEQVSIAGDVDRLHGMMQAMNQQQERDPEMQQLDGTLERILDIQHPERVKERQQELSRKNRQQVYAVAFSAPQLHGDHFGDTVKKSRNGFFSDANTAAPLQDFSGDAATAEVHGTQVVSNGATIKLRLSNDIYVNGMQVPKGSFVYGTASLEGERLQVTIPGIRFASSLLPVALSVYDLDGLAGIRVPGSINRDVAKQSTDAGLQSVDLLTMDPSLKAQATAVGVGAAKSLLSRKVKQVRVTLKSGYRVLLKDGNKQDR